MTVLYNVPKLFEIDVIVSDNGTAQWTLAPLATNSVYRTVYQNTMYHVFTFILPLLILTVVNTRVIIAYRSTLHSHRLTDTGSQLLTSQRKEKNITLVMIMIVLIFMACQAPARLVQVIHTPAYHVYCCRV